MTTAMPAPPCPPDRECTRADQFTYSCAYANNGQWPVTVGETQANEQCMTVGYYFPAGNASCQ
jgi:hypothetical protein